MPELKDYLTTKQAADILGISVQSVRQAVRNKKLNSTWFNGRLAFVLSDVEAYQKNKKVGAPYGNKNYLSGKAKKLESGVK